MVTFRSRGFRLAGILPVPDVLLFSTDGGVSETLQTEHTADAVGGLPAHQRGGVQTVSEAGAWRRWRLFSSVNVLNPSPGLCRAAGSGRAAWSPHSAVGAH